MDKRLELPFLAADDVFQARPGDQLYADLGARLTTTQRPDERSPLRTPVGRFVGVNPETRRVTADVPPLAALTGSPTQSTPAVPRNWVCRDRPEGSQTRAGCLPWRAPVIALGAPSDAVCSVCGVQVPGWALADVPPQAVERIRSGAGVKQEMAPSGRGLVRVYVP